jgi:Sybindin-like family.
VKTTSKTAPEASQACPTCWPLYVHAKPTLTPTSFVSFTTSQYKLHYYETPTNTKFVMLTDLKSPSMRIALQQIYINLFVEYGS